MAKLDLGEKYICQSCSTRFYDLNKRPIICPKCGAEYQPQVKKGHGLAKKARASEQDKAINTESAENDILDVDDFEEIDPDVDQDEELMEDTSDLGDNDHEMPNVKNHNELDNMEK